MYVYLYMCMYMYTYQYYTCTHIYICICTCIFICVNIYTEPYISYIYIYIQPPIKPQWTWRDEYPLLRENISSFDHCSVDWEWKIQNHRFPLWIFGISSIIPSPQAKPWCKVLDLFLSAGNGIRFWLIDLCPYIPWVITCCSPVTVYFKDNPGTIHSTLRL